MNGGKTQRIVMNKVANPFDWQRWLRLVAPNSTSGGAGQHSEIHVSYSRSKFEKGNRVLLQSNMTKLAVVVLRLRPIGEILSSSSKCLMPNN
jgi:hypothetical protein